MIISASRRTDMPAFYAPWFMNRIRAGFCVVRNPFNPQQSTRVSLAPADVDLIVFWTRNSKPLLPYLEELDSRGYPYYFLFTLLDYPSWLELGTPAVENSLECFKQLSELIGPHKVIWRYDPIVITNRTPIEFHKQTFQELAADLQGYTTRCIISLLEMYRKAQNRLKPLREQGIEIQTCEGEALADLMTALSRMGLENHMQLFSCAQEIDLTAYGIVPGKCIDDRYIAGVFGLQVDPKKDPSQRKVCGCVISKDIGAYDTCLFGCKYCYATNSLERAKRNYQNHDPDSEGL
jgi:hypothetical protein